jgi:hypothetical protein
MLFGKRKKTSEASIEKDDEINHNMVIGEDMEAYTEQTVIEQFGIRMTLGQFQHRYIAYKDDVAVAAVDNITDIPAGLDYFENQNYGLPLAQAGMVAYTREFTKDFFAVNVYLKNIEWYLPTKRNLPKCAVFRLREMPRNRRVLEEKIYKTLNDLYHECYDSADIRVVDVREITIDGTRLTGEISWIDNGKVVYDAVEYGTGLPVEKTGFVKADGVETEYTTSFEKPNPKRRRVFDR